MQDTVGFEQPSGLIGDQIQQITAWLRGGLLAYGLTAHSVERSRAIRVHESGRIVNLHLCRYRREAHGDCEVDGDFGANLDKVAPGGKTFGVQVEAIDAEGQVLSQVAAV